MNYRNVCFQFGLLMFVLGALMVLIGACAWALSTTYESFSPAAANAMLLSGGIAIALGVVVTMSFRKRSLHLGRREAMLLVAMSWVLGAAVAAMPYYVWSVLDQTHRAAPHEFASVVDCYFETMSGLTTTGATILSDIEAVPKSLLMWRSVTHWLGGIGIVVLFVAVLPSLGVGGKNLYRVETSGQKRDGLQPSIRESARTLIYLYLGMTVAEIVLLCIAGMSLFDSVCHTFSTLATGGLSPKNASIGAYHHLPMVDWIVLFFMMLVGINFGLYTQLMRGRFKTVWRDPELRMYVIVIAIAVAIVSISVHSMGEPIVLTDGQRIEATWWESLRESAFTVVSVHTGTGFCTSDFNLWPFFAQAGLVMMIFIGGCAGSTAGGIKVIRVWIAIKLMLAEIERAFRPNVIRPVRVGSTVIDKDLKISTLAYIVGIIVLFLLGSIVIMLLERNNPTGAIDYTTAAGASMSTLCIIGPGLGRVGAMFNYGWFSDSSKIVMCILMALGRLEVFAIVVLFSPRFWRGD